MQKPSQLTASQDQAATARWIAGKKEQEQQERIDLLRKKERNEKVYAAKQIAKAVQQEHEAATQIAEDTALKASRGRRENASARAAAEKKAQLIDQADEEAAKKKHDAWTKSHEAVNAMKVAKGEPPYVDDSFEKEIALIKARAKAREEEAQRQAEDERKAEAAEQARAAVARCNI